MANTRASTAGMIAALDAWLALLNVGGAGTIEIRTGAAPATCETADSGTVLAELTLSATAFIGAVDSTDDVTATANTITSETNAPAGGTAGHFRAKSGGGSVVIQGSITTSGGGGDMIIDNLTITSGDTVAVTAWTVTMPEI